MPIYEFLCEDCKQVFELLEMKKEDRVEAKCPKCGSVSFERVLSRTNYSLSGSASSSTNTGTEVNSRTCDGGHCTTVNIPGPSR